MEAVIDATLREYQSSRSVFNFGFSAWRAGVQRLLPLASPKCGTATNLDLPFMELGYPPFEWPQDSETCPTGYVIKSAGAGVIAL
jgi:hypothetical protein